MRLTVEWDREKRDSKKQNGTVYGYSVVVLLRSSIRISVMRTGMSRRTLLVTFPAALLALAPCTSRASGAQSTTPEYPRLLS
jgi:hypothetical protein